MRFDRTLGDVEIVSDFRVVTPLQQKVDNLLLPATSGGKPLFHNHYTFKGRTSTCRTGGPIWDV